MKFHLITIFPKIFDSYFKDGMLARAKKAKIIDINIHDLRQWTDDKRRSVDDTPYGGGAGMLMKIEPIYKALKAINNKNKKIKRKIILLSARGKRWNQQTAKKYSSYEEIILINGRYEGIDERIKKFIDEEISIGDYILTGGEIGSLVIMDSITRLLSGVLGNKESAKFESHSVSGILEYPQYTRPEIFETNGKKYKVPPILLSGNHKKIEDWRKKNSKKVK